MENPIQYACDTSMFPQSLKDIKSETHSEQSSKTPALPSRSHKKKFDLQSKYDTRLADAALRQAAEGGYLISPTRAFLLERCKTANKQTRSLRDIEYIHLSHLHIRSLGHIQSCRHLRICILHNNYLTRFNALENCPYLIRLDLHSNQITKLPDENFWEHMQSLQILNLHDNGIAKLESIKVLAACPNLIVLTLFDTPLSLKLNYRHHTVNTIWSLKAIDHHVVGDDEIIEDALFSKRFAAMNPLLYIDLCPKEVEPAKERTLELELSVVKKILSDINRILVHGSPVIVMQRWIRGFLCRRRLNISYQHIRQKLVRLNLVSQVRPTPGDSQVGEAFSLDYDTYLKNRRPGSNTSAATVRRTGTPSLKAPAGAQDVKDEDDYHLKGLPQTLRINLNQLERNALRSFNNSPDEEITIHVHQDSDLPSKSLFSKPLAVTFLHDNKRSRQAARAGAPVSTPTTAPTRAGRREPITVQQMLAPTDSLVHHGAPNPHPVLGTLVDGELNRRRREMATQCEAEVEVPNHDWRINDKTFEMLGGRPTVVENDPTQEYLVANRDAGKDVREAIEHWHEVDFMKPKPRVKKSHLPPRLKDNVSLATLMAVSKAYRDRDKADHMAMKMDRVMRVQQDRMQAKRIVTAYKEEKRSLAINQRQEDRMRIAEALQQHDTNKSLYVEFAQERKEKSVQRHRARHAELMFAADFNNQHTSVSNALIKHDIQATKDDLKADKTDVVGGIKSQLSQQADLVRKYMEHKQLSRQMAVAQERSRIDAQILQETNDRFIAARQRVAGLKARKAALQAYHRSLPATSDASAWPLDVPRELSVPPPQQVQSEPNNKTKNPRAPKTAPVLRIHEAESEQIFTPHANTNSSAPLDLPPIPPCPSASEEQASPNLSAFSSALIMRS